MALDNVPGPEASKKGDAALAKAKKQQQQRFSLHILLIMQAEGIEKAEAQFVAWLEGPAGLARRMPNIITAPAETKP